MWSLTSPRTKRISSFRKFRLLPPKDFFDSIGQTEKNLVRAYVFRFTPEFRHCSSQSACLKRAKRGNPALHDWTDCPDACSVFTLRRGSVSRRTRPKAVEEHMPSNFIAKGE